MLIIGVIVWVRYKRKDRCNIENEDVIWEKKPVT